MGYQGFDKHAAALLNAAGYVATHVEEMWKDIGGPENGPKITGYPAHQEWRTPCDHVIIVCDGEVVHSEQEQPYPEFDDIPF